MDTSSIIQIGMPLAAALASVYAPGGSQAVSALAAVVAVVAEYNKARAQPADYVPTREELTAFITERESKRIPLPDVPN